MKKNTLESIKYIGKKAKIFTTASIFFGLTSILPGCGGGGGSSGNNVLINDDLINSGETSNIMVQAGYVAGSEVTIKSLNGDTLYFGITDNNGILIINNNEFKKALISNGLNENSQILVEAFYGTDVDPDDDGNVNNDIDITVNGVLKSILSFNELNNSIINPISSKVVDILIGVYGNYIDELKNTNGDFDNEEIKNRIFKIITQIGVKDIDLDGKITNKDVINYDMVYEDSTLESFLKDNGYISTIHKGDNLKRNEIIESIKAKLDLSSENLGINNSNENIDFPEGIRINMSYKPIDKNQIIELQKIIDELSLELKTIQGDITSKSIELQNKKNQLASLESSYNSGVNSALITYNGLSFTAKSIIDPNITISQKNSIIDSSLNITSSLSSTNNRKVSQSSLNTNSLPNSNNINNDINILKTKISNLEKQIEPLKIEMENKYLIYQKKYNEYLIGVKAYEEDKRLAYESKALYDNLKTQYNNLDSQVLLLLRQKNLSSDSLSQLIQPKSSNYLIATGTYSSYVGTKSISKLVFSYRGKSIKGFFSLSSSAKFPGEMWLEVNGISGNKIIVNNVTHLNDLTNYFENRIKLELDFEYYSKEYQLQKDKLNLLKIQLDNAFNTTLEYGLVAFVDKAIYQASELDYQKAQANYDNAKAQIQNKLNQIEAWKSEIDILLGKIVSTENILQNYNYNIAQVGVIDKTVYDLTVLSGNKSQEIGYNTFKIDSLTKEYDEQVYFSLMKYSSNGVNIKLTDTNTKGTPFYTYIDKSDDYNNYPFTLYSQISRTKVNGVTKVYPASIWIEYKNSPNDTTVLATEKLEAFNYDHLLDIQAFLIKKVKNRINLVKNEKSNIKLQYLYFNVNLMSNGNCIECLNDSRFKGISKSEISSNLEFFANYLFEYKLSTDNNFRLNYENEIKRQIDLQINNIKLTLGRNLTQSEIDKIKFDVSEGLKGGVIKGTRDYLMEYIDLAKSLSELTLNDIGNGINNVWNFIKNPVDGINNTYQILKDGAKKAIDRLEYLGAYEYSYGGSYIGTNISLILGDPLSKIKNLGGVSKIVTKIDNTVLNLINNVLNTKVGKLGTLYVKKFDELSIKVVQSFDKVKQERFFKRMALMDDSIIMEYLNNPQIYIDDFERGGKYNMVKKAGNYPFEQYVQPFIITGGKIRNPNGYKITGGSNGYDFIIKNGEIKMGIKHDFLSNGENVDFAGKLYFTQDGIITKITEESGHYLPTLGVIEKELINNIFQSKNYIGEIPFVKIFTD